MSEARILVFGAHPDDVEFGMGGSILAFVDQGAAVSICVLTRGESGTYGTPAVREAEMRRAAATAGAEIEILDFQDCRVADDYESRLRLARVIRGNLQAELGENRRRHVVKRRAVDPASGRQ